MSIHDSDAMGLAHTQPEAAIEHFELEGHYVDVDWEEIDSPEDDDRPGIPHEEVMKDIRALLKRLRESR